jgi:hypothetical protein
LALSHEGNFPDRQWDVSRLGLVFAAKKEARAQAEYFIREHKKNLKTAEGMVMG